MNKYQNGKIYKIVDVGYTKCYIGSTCEKLSQRMARHRGTYKSYLKDNKLNTSSSRLFDEFGIENCKIELIEEYPCENKMELLRKEGEHIRNNNCVNKIIAGRTVKEYNEDNKEKISANAKLYKINNHDRLKQQRESNAEYLKQKSKEHYQANKGYINERHRQQYEANKEDTNKRHKQNYEKNREHIKQKYYENRDMILANQAQLITCPCGSIGRKGDKARHERTNKHQDWLQQQEQQSPTS